MTKVLICLLQFRLETANRKTSPQCNKSLKELLKRGQRLLSLSSIYGFDWIEPPNLVNTGSQYIHSIHWSHKESNNPQLHSPSPSLAPKCGSHFKTFLHGLLQGAERKERDRERKRRQGSGERLDLFEQSGCNESSRGLLEVDG